MIKGKAALFILCLTLGFLACDDDQNEFTPTPLRDRAEQQEKDLDSIEKYLNNHYFNSDELHDLLPNVSVTDIKFTALQNGASVPNGSTLLMEAVERDTVYLSNTQYIYYLLKINQGGGQEQPTFADNVLVSYEGFNLDDVVFDSSTNPTLFDLTTLIPVWRKVLPQFHVSQGFEEFGDGTVSYLDSGVGVMFAPSGLAYFSSSLSGIASYSSIIFKFELYDMEENDHDNDGIPSYLEDVNGDGEFTVNNEDTIDEIDDDSDGDSRPNYVDADDDGDGVLTVDEDINEDGDPTNDDTNENGIPNYLDPEE